MKLHKAFSLLLALNLIIGMALLPCHAQAAETVTGIEDMAPNHWAYETVLKCAQLGLINGTTPIQNGRINFNPNGTMTKAEFLAVVVRYLYPEEVTAAPAGDTWYEPYYDIAQRHGLMGDGFSTFYYIYMTEAMNRQEMAYVLGNALTELGQVPEKVIDNYTMPDLDQVGTAVRANVKMVYTAGLITGVDAKGTFNPKGILTRAQAATVIYRLVDPDARNPINPNTGAHVKPVKWVMGELHYDQPKEGDIIVVNGYEVVLEVRYGVLGAAQQAPDGTYVNVYAGWSTRMTDVVARDGLAIDLKDPETGRGTDKTPLHTDSRTGQMFSSQQWNRIGNESYPGPGVVGAYDKEVRNTFWQWNQADYDAGYSNGWDWIGYF